MAFLAQFPSPPATDGQRTTDHVYGHNRNRSAPLSLSIDTSFRFSTGRMAVDGLQAYQGVAGSNSNTKESSNTFSASDATHDFFSGTSRVAVNDDDSARFYSSYALESLRPHTCIESTHLRRSMDGDDESPNEEDEGFDDLSPETPLLPQSPAIASSNASLSHGASLLRGSRILRHVPSVASAVYRSSSRSTRAGKAFRALPSRSSRRSNSSIGYSPSASKTSSTGKGSLAHRSSAGTSTTRSPVSASRRSTGLATFASSTPSMPSVTEVLPPHLPHMLLPIIADPQEFEEPYTVLGRGSQDEDAGNTGEPFTRTNLSSSSAVQPTFRRTHRPAGPREHSSSITNSSSPNR